MNAPPPPITLRIGEVPKYLSRKYGLVISRQSVYNWINKGLRHAKLRTTTIRGFKPTAKHPLVQVTTTEWVDEFLRGCGVSLAQAGLDGDRA